MWPAFRGKRSGSGSRPLLDYLSHNLACGLSLTRGFLNGHSPAASLTCKNCINGNQENPKKNFTMWVKKYDPEQITET